jgi:hypothetical protein
MISILSLAKLALLQRRLRHWQKKDMNQHGKATIISLCYKGNNNSGGSFTENKTATSGNMSNATAGTTKVQSAEQDKLNDDDE